MAARYCMLFENRMTITKSIRIKLKYSYSKYAPIVVIYSLKKTIFSFQHYREYYIYFGRPQQHTSAYDAVAGISVVSGRHCI